MTIHLVTFATDDMSFAQRLCVESAERHGVSLTVSWTPDRFKRLDFYQWHKTLFDAPRAFGYWAWKPYVIADALACALKGDVVIYADVGVEFINNVSYIIERMDQDIFLFGNNWEHAHWCKRDVVEAVWPCGKESNCPRPHYEVWENFGKQVQASVIFFRISDYSRSFVAEWLKWCLFEGGRLIDDSPSRLPNHPEFREHRHDQAILTTMAYREGIRLHWWPSVYNRFTGPQFVYEKLPCYVGDSYPVIFHHHRLRNHEFDAIRPNAASAVTV